MSNIEGLNLKASDVARYFLYRAKTDGDYISPLRIQKLVYYAYVWPLILNNKKIFSEQIEAWPNGPVVPSLYQELKVYGFNPIDGRFLKINSDKEFDIFIQSKFDEEILGTLDQVYSKYMSKIPFELVLLTHQEDPWRKAQERLEHNGSNVIRDEDIIEYYSKKI